MLKKASTPLQAIVSLVVLVMYYPTPPLGAQEGLGTLTGRLVDQTDSPLPGVQVRAANERNGRTLTTLSDNSGGYQLMLEPGVYAIRFDLAGFTSQETTHVEVHVGHAHALNSVLYVAAVAETLRVAARHVSIIDTHSASVAHRITAEEIGGLPKGRSFQSIALTAPSVNSGDIEGGFQVNGASGAENVFTVDGVVTNSLINGSSRQNTVFEYIQEVQVKTTGIPAEFGGALGGVISAATKSGSNIVLREVHYYLDGSPLSAGPVKRLVLSPVDDRTVQDRQDTKQPDVRQEFGGSIGGPIVRDRLFFFGSLSPRINQRVNTYKFRTAPRKVPSTALPS